MTKVSEEHAERFPGARELCEELSYNLGTALMYVWQAETGSADERVGWLSLAVEYFEQEVERGENDVSQSAGSEARFKQLTMYHSENGTIPIGAPHSAKKLFRFIADEQKSNVLRQVIMALADDEAPLRDLVTFLNNELPPETK